MSDHEAAARSASAHGAIDVAGSRARSTPVALSVKAHYTNADDGRSPAYMPTTGGLVDQYGRVHSDLRISITDRCNLRCTYCMDEDMTFQPREQLLSFEELERIARIAHDLGVTAIRLTGGEPLVRRGVVDLIARLSAVGFADIAMTTNATRLAPLAAPLKAAGLTRVNISCDSLRAHRFASIRRRGDLATVLDAMEVAEAAGLAPLKVNVVLLRGINDDEILDFARFARTTGRIVRFIEFMPLDAPGEWDRDRIVPGREVYDVLNAAWPLEAVDEPGRVAPAERFRFADGVGEIGLISTVTEPFCGTCNRLRLTPDGSIRNCLFGDDEHALRELLRGGCDDAEVELVLRRAVWAKYPGHAINEPGFLRPHRSMSMIGG